MKRALISVYDKRGLVDFARELQGLGWEIVSTGGTRRALEEANIETIEIEEVTSFPEILDGRVKTLNPKIHGGILYKRDDKAHLKTLEQFHVNSIDMVVNNLYPFEETLKKKNVSQEEIIENIDIGGPSMIRAAAKNYQYVIPIIDPEDYQLVIEELKSQEATSLETRQYLAGKVFQYTAYYDSLIANYFNQVEGIDFPDILNLSFKNKKDLRYGENPHQKAAFYEEIDHLEGTLGGGVQLHGKELSFNNINDGNGALEMLKAFDEPTVVAVKHANPCGIGSGDNILQAYEKAYQSDQVSIFGGILAANREIDRAAAERINEIFIEILIAPSFTDEALEILKSKRNIRLIEMAHIMKNDYPSYDMKKVLGGILLQERDVEGLAQEIEVVTERQPSQEEMEDLIFAWKAVKGVKSNGVLLAKDKGTIGIGMGETNRVWAVEKAIERAGDQAKGAVLASDGFFPFKDSIEALAQAGITAIIQPGGSIRDEESIVEANKNNMAMVFTGIRHFKH